MAWQQSEFSNSLFGLPDDESRPMPSRFGTSKNKLKSRFKGFGASKNVANKQRPPWRLAVLGALLGGLLALVFFAPAAWLAQALAQGTGGQLMLMEASGSVWSGSARLQLTGGAQSRDVSVLPGRIHWTMRPQWLGIGVALRADCCTTEPLRLQWSPGWRSTQIKLSDGQSKWPATALAGLGTPWNTVLLEGSLSLSTQGLSVEWAGGRMNLQGRAQLDALDMASRLSTLKPLGSYRLELSGGAANANNPQPSAASLNLVTLTGDLQLTGSGQWVGSRLRFSGEASASPEREAALANLLNIVGRRQGSRSIISLG
jgi:general secretion pathway protein N